LYIFLSRKKTKENPVISTVQATFEKSCYFYMYQDKKNSIFADAKFRSKTIKKHASKAYFFISQNLYHVLYLPHVYKSSQIHLQAISLLPCLPKP